MLLSGGFSNTFQVFLTEHVALPGGGHVTAHLFRSLLYVGSILAKIVRQRCVLPVQLAILLIERHFIVCISSLLASYLWRAYLAAIRQSQVLNNGLSMGCIGLIGDAFVGEPNDPA